MTKVHNPSDYRVRYYKYIPSISVYRNHLEVLHSELFKFQDMYKSTVIVNTETRRFKNLQTFINHLEKNEPKEIQYTVKSSSQDEISLLISGGITIETNLVQLQFLGLANIIYDIFRSCRLPRYLVIGRRYWLIILLLTAFVISIICLTRYDSRLAIIFASLCVAFFIRAAASDIKIYRSFRGVNIQYQVYNYNPYSGLRVILVTAKYFLILVTSLATIISFISLVIK